jgi:hypothetical protein
MLAIEKHFKAAILLSAGLPLRKNLAEGDGINFDPDVSTPRAGASVLIIGTLSGA